MVENVNYGNNRGLLFAVDKLGSILVCCEIVNLKLGHKLLSSVDVAGMGYEIFQLL